ncbi:MAG: 4-hydroxy-tetrahydrodipicolinate synthase [Clostridia bacterium]|nr:4-hydroxy-tetrahydrodipicolinate synthase [Clostridia bacterium]
MKHPVFTGCATALVTPFTSDDHVNFDTLAKMIDFQIEGGVKALVMCGTTGEAATMSDDERAAVVEFTVNRVAGRIPVIAGTGTNDTKRAIWLSDRAKESGADALLVVTPYYNKCSQRGLIKYYLDIADSTDLPIIAYNVPSRTAVNLLPASFARIAEHPNVVGIKEACGEISQIMDLMRLCPETDLYSGNDDQVLPIMACGGRGVISTISNIMPRAMTELCEAFLNGDVAECRRLQFYINPLVKVLFSDVNPIPVKTAYRHMGFDVGGLRGPLCDMSPDGEKALVEKMKEYMLI